MEKTLKTVKGLSKAIYILAIIAKVFITIAMVIILLGMIAAPILIGIIETDGSELKFKGSSDTLHFVESENNPNELTLKFNKTYVADGINKTDAISLLEFFNKEGKTKMTICLEVGMLFGFISMLITRMILRRTEKLFKNINKEDTPFTDVNVKLLKKIGSLMIWSIVISIIGAIPFALLENSKYEFSIKGYSIIEILFVYVAAYIFEYEIQSKSANVVKEIEKYTEK